MDSGPSITERSPIPEKEMLRDPAVFDWTKGRKDGVIKKSKDGYNSFIDGLAELSDSEKTSMRNLWTDIVDCFQNGGDLKINGQKITSFNKNTLAAHSEYHVSKILTLAMRLLEVETPDATLEDKVTVALGVLVHDLGSLQRQGDSRPQPLLYEKHELYSIGLVDSIVDALGIENIDRETLKAKVKLMVATTLVQFDMDFDKKDINNLPIIRLLQGEDPGQVFNSEDKYRDEMVQAVLELKKKLTAGQIEKLIPYIKIMGASDMGSYLLEICRMGEINSLFQETHECFWDEEKKKFRHRALPPGIKTYRQYLVSKFPETQRDIYGSLLRKLGKNPFAEDYTAGQTLQAIDKFKILLENPGGSDPLLRFEGYFPPKDLLILMKDLGFDVSVIDPNDQNNSLHSLQDALYRFSKDFSGSFHEPGKFDALATEVLREIFKLCTTPEKRKEFFRRALELIDKDTQDEVLEGGSIHLHFAPFAYAEKEADLNDVISPFSEAVAELNKTGKRRIASVTLTLREDKKDEIESLTAQVNTHSSEAVPWQISIGGQPGSAEALKKYLERTGKIKTVVHFGLDETFEAFDQRLDVVLQRDVDFTQIHVDDHYKRFADYEKHLDLLVSRNEMAAEEKRERLERLAKLIKSVNPLGAVLTRGVQEYKDLMDFFAKFPESRKQIASHNACLYGGLGLVAQRLLAVISSMSSSPT